MTPEQIRTIWNVAEVVIEQLVSAAEASAGASPADRRSVVQAQVAHAIGVVLDQQHLVTGTTEVFVAKGLTWVADLLIDKALAAVPAPALTGAK